MALVCYLVIANAMMATFLAGIVWFASRYVRQAVVLHVLWMLVLLRLVVPPFVLFRIDPIGRWVSDTVATADPEVARDVLLRITAFPARYLSQLREYSAEATGKLIGIAMGPCGVEASEVVGTPTTEAFSLSRPADTKVGQANAIRQEANHAMRAASDRSSRRERELDWIDTLGLMEFWGLCQAGLVSSCETVEFLWEQRDRAVRAVVPIWLCGMIAKSLLWLFRCGLFRRRMRQHASHSVHWQGRVARVGRRMGLCSYPQVMIVQAVFSPMLWGFGRSTRIVLPQGLLDRLGRRGQDSLIAHELAHYHRGDQWVRLLESLAKVVFWWHPLVWWVSARMHEQEEICCDAWAVTQTRGGRRAYAEVLLDAVDFLSVGGVASSPSTASELRGANNLRERISAIMGCNARLRLGHEATAAVLLAALLALLPSLALWP